MAMVGFNPDQVRGSISRVENAYAELVRALCDEVQNNYIGDMSKYWACNEARTFYATLFKPAIDELLDSSFEIFDSVVGSMNSAAQSWANQTDSSWATVSFGGAKKTVSVDAIQENINGVRGVDEDNAKNTTSSRLAAISNSTANALDSAKNAVTGCGFVGRDQEQQLINALETIKQNINNAFSQLQNATNRAIDNTVATYGNIATNVGNAFNG